MCHCLAGYCWSARWLAMRTTGKSAPSVGILRRSTAGLKGVWATTTVGPLRSELYLRSASTAALKLAAGDLVNVLLNSIGAAPICDLYSGDASDSFSSRLKGGRDSCTPRIWRGLLIQMAARAPGSTARPLLSLGIGASGSTALFVPSMKNSAVMARPSPPVSDCEW